MSPEESATASAQEIEKRFADLDEAALEALVRRANREYWEEQDPTLPDTLYDRLVEELRRVNPKAKILEDLGSPVPEGEIIEDQEAISIPPVERLGAPVRHLRPMLSLEKCYEDKDLLKWSEKFEGDILVMPKLDGMACSLRYNSKGELYLAATRGSGSEGEDITINTFDIDDIPNKLPPKLGKNLEIRGEIYMRLSVFKRYAEEYSNPRNLTAGAVKHKDRGYTKSFTLSFFPYDVDGRDFKDEHEKETLLKKLGLPRADSFFCTREEMAERYEYYSKKRAEMDFEIDGVVYRAVDVGEQKRLGETGHHPRHSIAYKFQGDTGVTTLTNVEWSVSRTGTITPVARFEGIDLSGAKISRASLHNLSRFRELDLRKGAQIEVTRRGGVIPMVERVVERPKGARRFALPTECPACGGPVEEKKIRDGEFLSCVDPKNCVQARQGELKHFADVVKIDGFGPKILTKAMDAGLLSTPDDFYRLQAEDLAKFERLGRKSAQNLIDEIEARRILPLATFLQALGIESLGQQNAQLLVREFKTLDRIRGLTQEDLCAIKGVKEKLADAIVSGLAHRSKLIDALLGEVQVDETIVENEAPADGPLAGQSFLFTGTLEAFDRKTAQKQVEALGGTSAKSVTKDLSVLVVGAGKGPKSSKQKKAESLQAQGQPIKMMSESEFLELLSSHEA